MQTLLQNLLNGIAAGSIYALIALGYTMVYGILKLINFAHGDVFMLGSFVGYYAGREATKHMGAGEANSPLAAAGIMLLAMVVCGAFGYLNERIAYRPLRNAPRIASRRPWPASRCNTMFSTTTMASSITRPTAAASPRMSNRERRREPAQQRQGECGGP